MKLHEGSPSTAESILHVTPHHICVQEKQICTNTQSKLEVLFFIWGVEDGTRSLMHTNQVQYYCLDPALGSFKKSPPGTGEVAQQVKALAAKPDTMSSTLRSHMVHGEDQVLRADA